VERLALSERALAQLYDCNPSLFGVFCDPAMEPSGALGLADESFRSAQAFAIGGLFGILVRPRPSKAPRLLRSRRQGAEGARHRIAETLDRLAGWIVSKITSGALRTVLLQGITATRASIVRNMDRGMSVARLSATSRFARRRYMYCCSTITSMRTRSSSWIAPCP